MAGEQRTEPGLARVFDLAVPHQTDVERGAARINHQHVAAQRLCFGVGAPGERRHGGAGFDHVDRPVSHVLHVHQPAGNRADKQFALEADALQIFTQLGQVALHARLERRIDRGRRRAGIFAEDRVDAVGKSVGDARQHLFDQRTEARLVFGIFDRPQQANRDRLDIRARKRFQRAARRRFVERLFHAALGIDTLGDFKR